MGLMPDLQGVLSKLYTDLMDVQRYNSDKDADGNTVAVLNPVPELTGIPCRLSFSTPDSPVMAADGNPTDTQLLLICAPDVPLKSGDFVTVTRDGAAAYSGNIGRPNPYQNSLQVLFRDKGVS
jgi:hypothetical protein